MISTRSAVIGVIIIVIALFFCFSIFGSAKLRVKTAVNVTNSDLIFNLRSVAHTSLAYALCENLEQSAENHCTVVLHKHGLEDALECKVTLKAQSGGYVGYFFRVYPFNADKAILVWADDYNFGDSLSSYLKFRIIRFPDCSATEANITYTYWKAESEVDNVDVSVYEDAFDVLFVNDTLCESQFCRVTFNIKGDKIDGPVSWFSQKVSTAYLNSGAAPAAKGFLFFYPITDWKSEIEENTIWQILLVGELLSFGRVTLILKNSL